ncbi:MAG: hypothetical protein U0V64_12960 [Cyclobacteriaceae bacterium]
MKHLLTTMLWLLCHNVYAQKAQLFQSYLTAEKSYKITQTSDISGELNFMGSEELVEQLKQQYGGLPLLFTAKSNQVMTTTTGAIRPDQSVPFETHVDEYTTTQNMGGQTNTQANPIQGMVIAGHLDSRHKVTIDTLFGTAMTPELKGLISTVIDVAQIQFPERPLKKGDSFDQDVPIEIPVAGVATMKMNIHSTYTLTGIEQGLGKFDVVQVVTLNMPDSNLDLSATGNGTGKGEFNIAQHMLTSFKSDLTMVMKVNIDGMEISLKMKSITDQKVIQQ